MILVDPAARWLARLRPLCGGTLLLAVVGLVGCIKPTVRPQSEEETDRDRYGVRAVGDITTFGNADPVAVGGVGLVTGLAGTGGAAPPSNYRTLLENDLKKKRVENIKEILNSSDNSLVLISALIPPGSRKGDPLDLEISLPPGSKTTSLRGGFLQPCVLFNYETARNISSNFDSNKAILGHPVAKAEGPLLVAFGEGDQGLKQARIWGGGKSNIDIPFHLILNSDQQYARVAEDAASRVNGAFQGGPKGMPSRQIAAAKNNAIIMLGVPPQYRLNHPRYMRVVRLVPMRENLPLEDGKDTPRRPYRQQLQDDLLDPARTVVAALRLEALGEESIPALKAGLLSKHPLVRFCAAESLAYLGSPACGEELGEVVKNQPFMRSFALTAMASLDEAVSHVKLKELLLADLDPETRYGAFRALRALDPNGAEVRGELLNESFHLHQVPGESRPLVHLTLSKRAEVVVFGKPPQLKPPFALLAGTFAITAGEEDQRCTVTFSDLDGDTGVSRSRCSLDLVDVIRSLASQGATYPEIVALIRQAEASQALNTLVRFDALPQAVTVQELANAGKQKSEGAEGEGLTLIRPTAEMGSTPTLYEKPGKRSPSPAADIKALTQKKETPTPAVSQVKE